MRVPPIIEGVVFATTKIITREEVQFDGSDEFYIEHSTAQRELIDSVDEYRRVSTLPTAEMRPSEVRAHLAMLDDYYYVLNGLAESVLDIRHRLIQAILENSAEYVESGEDKEIEKVVKHFSKINFDASCLPIAEKNTAAASNQFNFMVRCVPAVRKEIEQSTTRRARIIHLRRELSTTGKHLANCSAAALNVSQNQ